MEFLHVCLNVADADRTADWYVTELGFERTWEFTLDDGAKRNVYVADENGIELQLAEAEGRDSVEPGTAWDHLAVKVEDVDGSVESIDHFGLVKGPLDLDEASARIAFIKDPDGHHVELVEPYE